MSNIRTALLPTQDRDTKIEALRRNSIAYLTLRRIWRGSRRCVHIFHHGGANWSAHYDLVHKDKCAPERITVGESRILKLLAGGEPCN